MRLLAAVLLIIATPALAISLLPPAEYANRQLPDPAQEAKARELMDEIRCLVCQGESVADSPAEMAGDMRALIRTRIQAGESPEQNPRMADLALRRLGELQPAVRPGHRAALGRAGAVDSVRPVPRARALQAAEEGVSGWLATVLLALLAGLGLGFFLRRDKAVLQFTAAALLLAFAGYSWQGSPAQPGAPKGPPERQQLPDTAFAQAREETFGRFNRGAMWLNMAESFQRRGDHLTAAQLLQNAVGRNPRDMALWLGFGNALVLHGGGMMSSCRPARFPACGADRARAPGAALLLRRGAGAERQL